MTCTGTYAVTQADIDAGSVYNVATADSQESLPSDGAYSQSLPQRLALALVKSANQTTYATVGDVIHYNYRVTNTGNVTLHQAIVVSDNKTTATCPALTGGGLAPGAFITCTASYAIVQADLDAGAVTNTASAASGPTASNGDTVTVTATKRPALQLVKSANPATYTTAGQTINYGYALKNTGNVTLSGPLAVTDDKATASARP